MLALWVWAVWAWALMLAFPMIGSAATLVLWVLILPLGRRLITRVALICAVLVAVAWIVQSVGLPLTHTSVTMAAGLSSVAMLAWGEVRQSNPRLRVSAADWVVLVAAAATALEVLLPTFGASPEDSIDSIANYDNSWDNSHHFALFADAVGNGGAPLSGSDGSAAWFAVYPRGSYAVARLVSYALFPISATTPRVDLIWPYLLVSALMVAAAVVALGFIAVDLARRPSLGGPSAGIWAAVGVGLMATLGDLAAPLVIAGHWPFLMAAALTGALSWIVFRSGASRRSLALVAIPVGLLVGWAVWAPLALTMVPPAILLVAQVGRLGKYLAAAAAGLLVIGLVLVLPKLSFGGKTVVAMAVELGHNGGFNMMIALLGLPLCVAAAFWLPGLERGTRIGIAVLSLPLIVGALSFGRVANSNGFYWGWSYYTLKMLNGATLALIGLYWGILGMILSVALRQLTATFAGRSAILAVHFSVLMLLAIPMGYAGPGIMKIKTEMPLAPSMAAIRDRTQSQTAINTGHLAIGGRAAPGTSALYPSVYLDPVSSLENIWLGAMFSYPSVDQMSLIKTLATQATAEERLSTIRAHIDAHPQAGLNILCSSPADCQVLFNADLSTYGERIRAVKVD